MAKPQSRSGTALSRFVRRERGDAIPVETRKVTLKDGSSGEVSTLSLANAEVPDRSYYGDACAVGYANETVRIVFAQPKLGNGNDFRTLVMISMTPASAVQFVRSVD